MTDRLGSLFQVYADKVRIERDWVPKDGITRGLEQYEQLTPESWAPAYLFSSRGCGAIYPLLCGSIPEVTGHRLQRIILTSFPCYTIITTRESGMSFTSPMGCLWPGSVPTVTKKSGRGPNSCP